MHTARPLTGASLWEWRKRSGLASVAALCLFALTSGGCSQKAVQNAASSPSPVSQGAEYRQAKALFGQHNYAASDQILASLLAEPQRTAADHLFLQRQRDLCRRAQDGEKTLATASLTRTSSVTPAAAAKTIRDADCGPRALLLLCRKANRPAALSDLRRTAGITSARGASLEGLSKAAASVGFAPLAVQMDRDALANLSVPAIAWVDGNHYVAVYQVNRSLRGITFDTIVVHDPNKRGEETLTLTDLLSRSGGVLLTLPTKQAEKRLGRSDG